jgi:type IV secretory pathway VirJ component
MGLIRLSAVALLAIGLCATAQAVNRPAMPAGAHHAPHVSRDQFIGSARTSPLHIAAAPAVNAGGTALGAPNEVLSHGHFKDVAIYRPEGEVKQFVLFLSGRSGWNGTAAAMADALADEGVLVAGIDTPKLIADFKREGASCVFPDGDLENLSHFVQAYYKLPTYLTPVLAGYSAGASFAYSMAEQAPRGLFAGALSVGSDGHFDALCAKKPLATPRAEKVSLPAAAQQGGNNERAHWMPQLKGALARITGGRSEHLPPPPKSLADLPLIEVPPTNEAPGDVFAVLFSGDGGWAGLDRELAQALADRGIPVAGLDSLRYFWTARTPETVAQDLDRTLRYYASHWGKSRALLIGYSQGADVMPFAVNRLPSATRDMVSLTTLLGVGDRALFEFHLTNWISDGRHGLPVAPEIEKLTAAELLCIYGADDDESSCSKIDKAHARVLELPGGHHFDGDYGRVATLILEQAGVAPTPVTATTRGS